jgi:hypothetical protein
LSLRWIEVRRTEYGVNSIMHPAGDRHRPARPGGRVGESFVIPAEQRDRVAAACPRDGLVLVATINELDISGGTALERRPGLRSAVEAGDADVVVAASTSVASRTTAPANGEVRGERRQEADRVCASGLGGLRASSHCERAISRAATRRSSARRSPTAHLTTQHRLDRPRRSSLDSYSPL